MSEQPQPLPGRHLTSEQREDISAQLQGSTPGPVSMTAAASDKEAVCYQGEIANVLEDAGCEVKIDNAKGTTLVSEIPDGVEATIREETVRPAHAQHIVSAFRRAGVAIAASINGRRRRNDTVYIAVGSNNEEIPVPPITQITSPTLLEKWKLKFAGWLS